jgi:uncharacterized protein YqeY
MGEIKDDVSKQIATAMKAKDKIRLNVLRYLKKLFIENDTSGNPIPEIDIVISHAKKTKDSIAAYPANSPQRAELEQEVVILNEFLPKALSEDDVMQIIAEIKCQLASPNMGAIMKELTTKIKGKFDGKRASDLVKEALK